MFILDRMYPDLLIITSKNEPSKMKMVLYIINKIGLNYYWDDYGSLFVEGDKEKDIDKLINELVLYEFVK